MSVKRRIIGIVTLILLLCVGLTAYLLLHFIDTPSQSKITNAPKTTATTAAFNSTPTIVHNKFFTFSYPAALNPQTQQPLSGSEIASYGYTYRDVESWQLTVVVLEPSAPILGNDSAYSYRIKHPEQYQLSTETVDGLPVQITTDTEAGGFSKVAFVQHGTEIANISLLGDDSSGTGLLNKTFSQVIDSWVWNNN
jgi:hypothetical protein